MIPNVQVTEHADTAATIVRDRFVTYANQAIGSHERFSVALSGGTTPKAAYELIAKADLDWKRIHVFLVDERCVPIDSPERTERMLRDIFTSLPAENLHPLYFEGTPESSAQRAIEDLRFFFNAPLPQFDFILLGVGEDGHTASLFPDDTLALESNAPVVAIHHAPKPPPERVSLSLATINAASHVTFFVVGESKAKVVRSLIQDHNSASPAGRVTPLSGNLEWILDKDAATLLG